MKRKLVVIVAILLLAIPAFAQANHQVPADNGAVTDTKHQQDWEEKRAERERLLLSWVDEFTPEKKAEWTKVLEERKALRNKWMSPENAEKREQWKKDKIAKITELRKLVEEGKITKEEFIHKLHGEKGMGYWKYYHDLESSVAEKDQKQSAELLNQLLAKYKEHNQIMAEMLNH